MTNGGYCVRRRDVDCNLPQRDEPRRVLHAVIGWLMCREIVLEVERSRRRDKMRRRLRGGEDGADPTAERGDLQRVLCEIEAHPKTYCRCGRIVFSWVCIIVLQDCIKRPRKSGTANCECRRKRNTVMWSVWHCR